MKTTYATLLSRLIYSVCLFILSFFSLIVSPVFAQSPTCDIAAITAAFTGAGYVPLNVQGQPCSMYFVNPASLEAGQAQAAAAALGANLVWMNDAAENAAVTAALNASAYSGATIWIGVQRTGAGSANFYASDGTTGPFPPSNGNPNIYQNWAGGEPNNSGYGDTDWLGNCDYECTNGEQCVQIYQNGQWNDLQCNESSRSVIEVNLCPEITVAVSANNICSGNPSTLTATTLLGSQPYQYAWSTNEITAAITVTPLQTTTYDVAVSDRYSCSATESVTITTLAGPSATFDVGSSVCIGSPAVITYTGSAAANATYTWNFGTGIVVSGSGQGPYQVGWAASGPQAVTLEVTENGCTSPVQVNNVTVSPSPTADFTFTIVCEGNPTTLTNTSTGNGAVILGSAWVVEGDTTISTDFSHTFSGAGTFPVTLAVLTIDSCYATVTQQVTVNPGPTAVFSSTDVTCFGACDGTAQAVVQGGAPPVTVTWSNGTVGNAVSPLCPGALSGTVADANGCEIVGQVDITEPADLTVVVNVTETTCPGLPTGTATAVPAGGTAPYTTDWGGLDPNMLLAGNYIVTITDANGCTVAEPYTIVDGVGLIFSYVVVDNVCFGGNDGSAILTVSNGVAPYDIAFTDAFGTPLQVNPATQGVASISGLAAGTYNVGSLDATGCQQLGAFTITQPAVDLVMNLTPQDLNCFESGDGQIGVNQNGLSPYTYSLSDVFGAPLGNASAAGSHSFNGLDVGIYFVNVTDANGCTTTDAVELFQPDLLEAESTVTPVSCYLGSDGTVTITQITGGTAPYAPVVWNDPNSQVGSAATGLPRGTYTATITDANGCELEQTFTLTEPPEMRLTPSYLTDTCGQGFGAAIIQAGFGTPPYTYFWKPDGVLTATHYNLTEGSYEVVVTDANGCKDSTFVEVTDDLPLPLAAFDYRIEGEHVLDEVVQFVNHSVGTIQWKWNFGDGQSSNQRDPIHSYDAAGDYLVQLLGSNGYCNDTAYQYVNIDPLMAIYIPNAFTPGDREATQDGNNDYFFPQGEGIEEDSYDMFIFDRWGKIVWQTGKYGQKWDGRHMTSLEMVPTGTYVYQITFREFADLDRHVYNGVVHVIRQ
ncbi:MAG: gliding motility-associated C-terminal domain-containing protein [Flavobacteriales bacterium]|nr:gliding motility-associated C-terminal domain-containing protein [Flavobacteriales bacterium]